MQQGMDSFFDLPVGLFCRRVRDEDFACARGDAVAEEPVSDLILRACECISDLILRSRAFLRGVSKDGRRLRVLRPSFETLAEFIIGPRYARTRWQAPQDEDGDSFTNSEEPTQLPRYVE